MAKATNKASEGTALAVLGDGGRDGENRITKLDYAIAQLVNDAGAGGDVALAIKENIGSNQLSAFDFDRIRVPAGGGIAWEVLDPETGQADSVKEIEGVIVYWNDQKAFWKRSLDEQGATKGPPDCFSPDTKQGIGDPGIACATCPNNKFGTAKGGQGKGKACKDVRLLFLIRKDDLMPVLIPIPPTSIKGVKKYFLTLASRAVPYWQAVSKIRLVKDKNTSGIEYSKVEITLGAILSAEAKDATRAYGTIMREMLGQAHVQVKPEDLTGDGSDGGETVTEGDRSI